VAVDVEKVKRNIAKMQGMGATEAEIEAYVAYEAEQGIPPQQQPPLRQPVQGGLLDEPASTGGNFRTFIDQFNQGTTAGWADEITDPLAASLSVLATDPIGFLKGDVNDPALAEELISARENTQRTLAAQQAESPWLSAGANITGALTGAGAASKLIPQGVAAGAAKFAKANPKTAAALAGGGWGGLYSLGSSENEGLERGEDLLVDVPMSMAGGVVGAKAGQALARGAGAVKAGYDKTADVLGQAGRKLGILGDDLAAPVMQQAPAATAAAPLQNSASVIRGLLDEPSLARLDKGQVLPLTAGEKSGAIPRLRLEQTAAQSGSQPILNAREMQREAIQKPFKGILGEGQLMDDVALAGRSQEELLGAANLLRGQYDDLGRRVNQAYTVARETGEGVGIKAQNIQEQFLDEIDNLMNFENVRRGDIPKFDSVMDELSDIIKPLHGEERKAFSANHMTLNALEAWKKRLNRTIGNTAEPADKRILERVSRQYDDFLTNLADDAIINGDDTAISAFKDARKLAREKFAFYESDKAVQRILDSRDMTGDKLINLIIGGNKIANKGDDGRIVEKLLRLAGDKEPIMREQMRVGVVAKIMEDGVRGHGGARKDIFDFAGAVNTSLKNLMKSRETFDALFDETERGYFKSLSNDLAKIAYKPVGSINRSGTGAYTADLAVSMGNIIHNPLFSRIPGINFGTGLIKAGADNFAKQAVLGTAEKGLDDFAEQLAKELSKMSLPAIYYGSIGGSAYMGATDPIGGMIENGN
jgi:hypothetical protein